MEQFLPGHIPEPFVIVVAILFVAAAGVRLGRGLVDLGHDLLGLLRDWRDFRRGD